MIESGEYGPPPCSDECRRCGEKPGRGASWTDQGVVFWQCDDCGHTQHEGVLEEVNREQIEKLRALDRAKEHQIRFMNEKWVKMDETRRGAKERPGVDVAKEMWDDTDIFYHDTAENIDNEKESHQLAKNMTQRIHALQ